MSDLLSIANSALNTAESALAVIANDTANSSNPAYVNETLAITDGPVVGPITDTLESTMPTGASNAGIDTAHNALLSARQQTQISTTSYWNTVAASQTTMQPWFNEPQTGGLQEELNQFGSAWTTYQDNPGTTADAATVESAGQSLASTLQQIQSQLAQQASSLTQQLGNQLGQVATLSQTLASSNTTAPSLPPASAAAANLQNTIQSTVQALASLTSIQTLPQADGSVTVNSGGVSLVHGTTATPQSAYAVTVPSGVPWYQATPQMTIQGTAYHPTSGAVAGTLTALGQVQSAGAQLAAIAQTLATHVTTGSSTTPTFFTATANGALQLASTVTTASLSPSAAASNLTTITQATTQWTNLVGTIGSQGQQALQTQASSQADLNAITNQVQSTMGVNLNQTAVDTVQEQQAYQAAAQLITVQQTLVNTLLNAVS